MKKTKYKIIAIIMTVLVVILISVLGVKKMTEPTQHEKQVTFLKEHENEMSEYIKKTTEIKVSKVTFDFNAVEEHIVGNGLPGGAGKVIQIFGFINNNENLDFRLDIQVNNDNMPNLNTIQYGQALTN